MSLKVVIFSPLHFRKTSLSPTSLKLRRRRLPIIDKSAYENPDAMERYPSSSIQYAEMLVLPLAITLRREDVRVAKRSIEAGSAYAEKYSTWS